MIEAAETLTPAEFEHELSASRLGMWVFLATEVLFFGTLFVAFTVDRSLHPSGFAFACEKLDLFLGSLNTGVLLTSSLAMAAAVHRAKEERWRACGFWLAATAVLGAAFLAVKGFEWSRELHEGLWPGASFHWEGGGAASGPRLFFALYFCMTGLHALHMLIGMGAVVVACARCLRARMSAASLGFVENLGLYWHFVDIVWIWLFPYLYLLGRAH
jgi:cytochrome c oxidase subunit 3